MNHETHPALGTHDLAHAGTPGEEPGSARPQDLWDAATLLRHHDEGQPWPQAEPVAPLPLDQAYQRQLEVRALRLARGEQPRGFKIGFTNRGIWARYNVFAPIWGTVYDGTLTMAEAEAEATLDLARTCEPRLEPEAVFGMRQAPPESLSLQALYDSIEWVAPGFEVVQSHRNDWRFGGAGEPVADGSLHAHLLVGRRVPVRSIAPDGPTLARLLSEARVELREGERVVEQGVGANVLDGPLQALMHFVAELRRCPGGPLLRAGDVVTTGTWTDAWPVGPGQCWSAGFSAPLSALRVRFR